MSDDPHAPMIEAAMKAFVRENEGVGYIGSRDDMRRALSAAFRAAFIELKDDPNPPPLMTWLSETADELDDQSDAERKLRKAEERNGY